MTQRRVSVSHTDARSPEGTGTTKGDYLLAAQPSEFHPHLFTEFLLLSLQDMLTHRTLDNSLVRIQEKRHRNEPLSWNRSLAVAVLEHQARSLASSPTTFNIAAADSLPNRF
jgi:hypothetical protein